MKKEHMKNMTSNYNYSLLYNKRYHSITQFNQTKRSLKNCGDSPGPKLCNRPESREDKRNQTYDQNQLN